MASLLDRRAGRSPGLELPELGEVSALEDFQISNALRFQALPSGVLVPPSFPALGAPCPFSKDSPELHALQERISRHQSAGYQLRIAMQSGRLEPPAALLQAIETPQGRAFREAFGVKIEQIFGALGREVLDLLRVFAQQLAAKGVEAIDPRVLRSTLLLSGLPDRDGSTHYLPPPLVLHLASSIHDAWRCIMLDPRAAGHISSSAPDLHRQGALFRDVLNVPASVVNMDALGALCISLKLLGEMSELDFQLLRQRSPVGNPLRMPLEIAVIERGARVGLEHRVHGAEVSTPETASALVPDYASVQKRYAQRPFAEIERQLSALWATIEKALIREEERELLPSALRASDAWSTATRPRTEYENLLLDMRGVLQARDAWLDAMQFFGKALVPTVPPAIGSFDDARVRTQELLKELFPASCHAYFAEKFVQYNAARESLLARCAALQAPDPLCSTESLSVERAWQLQPEIDRMVKEAAARRLAGEATGLRFGHYGSQEFLQSFLAHEGRIIGHWQAQQLNGIFMWYPWPDLVPQEHLLVPREALLYRGDVQYGRVIAIEKDRSSGTFERTEGAALCAAQLFAAPHLKGFIFERNERSRGAFVSAEHLPLMSGATLWRNTEGEPELHVPVLAAVDPAQRSEFAKRAKILSDVYTPSR